MASFLPVIVSKKNKQTEKYVSLRLPRSALMPDNINTDTIINNSDTDTVIGPMAYHNES